MSYYGMCDFVSYPSYMVYSIYKLSNKAEPFDYKSVCGTYASKASKVLNQWCMHGSNIDTSHDHEQKRSKWWRKN